MPVMIDGMANHATRVRRYMDQYGQDEVEQFIDVCRQNRIMPPKSTWFQPKIRSGLVMALLR